jgi:hypothetical protein
MIPDAGETVAAAGWAAGEPSIAAAPLIWTVSANAAAAARRADFLRIVRIVLILFIFSPPLYPSLLLFFAHPA